jgi:hypothetical protein
LSAQPAIITRSAATPDLMNKDEIASLLRLKDLCEDFGELSRAATADLAPRLRLNGQSEATARFVGGFAPSLGEGEGEGEGEERKWEE